MWLARVIYGVLIIPLVLVTPYMGMAFDSPGAANSIFVQMFYWSVVSCPVTLVCSIIMSFHDARWFFLPLINVALFIVVLMGIELLQGGRFTP
jgi:hypothetical protein